MWLAGYTCTQQNSEVLRDIRHTTVLKLKEKDTMTIKMQEKM